MKTLPSAARDPNTFRSLKVSLTRKKFCVSLNLRKRILIEEKLLCKDFVYVNIDVDRGKSGAGITYYELSALF